MYNTQVLKAGCGCDKLVTIMLSCDGLRNHRACVCVAVVITAFPVAFHVNYIIKQAYVSS